MGFHRKKDRLKKHLVDRLKNVDFECRDAVKVIKSRDTQDSFFFIDPPAFNNSPSAKKHSTYTPEDYIVLLDTLAKIK